MNKIQTSNAKDKAFLFSGIGLLLLALGLSYIFSQNQSIQTIIFFLIAGLVTISFFALPPLGLALVIVSTPLVDLLPKVPFLGSSIPILGLIAVAAYFVNKRYQKNVEWNFSPVEITSIVFIIWVILSNPTASIFGEFRSWILTFVQLFVLLFLAAHFVQSKDDHMIIMIIVSMGILISAFVAVIQSGGDFNEFQRAAGLSGGANTAARYFVYGLVLFLFLQDYFSNKWLLRLFFIFGILILFSGIVLSGSRSGIVLLLLVILTQVLQSFSGKTRSTIVFLLLIVGLFWYLNVASDTYLSPQAISTSIYEGTDTVGARYDAWEVGWNLFVDHPIRGVGIDMYSRYAPKYWSPTSSPVLSPHNTFIQVLSETGAIGLLLFGLLIFLTIKNSWHKVFHSRNSRDNPMYGIRRTWFILLIILLVGALTKTDLSDKLFWFLLGINGKALKEI